MADVPLRKMSHPYRPLQEEDPEYQPPAPTAAEEEPMSSEEGADITKKEPEEESPYVDLFILGEVQHIEFWRAVLAEFFATKFFVAFSILGIISAEQYFEGSKGAEHAFVLLYHMLLILIVIYVFAHLSGAHFNPAVSITVVFCRRISIMRCIFYVAAQLLGAISGASVAEMATPEDLQGTLGQPLLKHGVSVGSGFLMEFFASFGLLFGSFATAFDPRGWGHLGPVAICIIVALNIHAGAFISGPAMNPARAFGPAVVRWVWDDHWIYWVGDLCGAILGGTIYEYIFMKRKHSRIRGVPSTGGDNHVTQDKKNN